ncbi:MAG: ABC transporter ATP-binding protein [Lentisphaerae bacterium]|nr:ABC transporter ATP-binding protein [Lentisphaerota bacterium]
MRQFFRDIFYLFRRRDRWRFLALIFLQVIGTGVELLSLASVPVFVALLSDSYGDGAFDLPVILIRFSTSSESSELLVSSIIFVGLFAFRTLYFYISCSLQQRILNNRCVELGSRLFSAYMSAPYSFLLRHNSQDLVNKVVVESERVVNRVLGPAFNVLRSLLVLLAIVLVLLLYKPLITLVAFALLLVFAGIFLYFNRRKTRQLGEQDAQNRERALSQVAEGIGAYKEIKVSGSQRYFQQRLHESLERIASSRRWLEVNQQIIWPYLELVTVSVMVIATFMAISLSEDDFRNVAPAMAFFAAALFRLKGYVTDGMLNFGVLRYNWVSVSLVSADLRSLEKKAAQVKEDDAAKLPFEEWIRVEGLCFRYEGSSEATLQNVNLSVRQGSTVALVGATGSGKSSMLNLILGFLRPQQGSILVDGRDIQENLPAWQQQIGLVPQQIFLLDASIRENVAFGVPRAQVDEAALQRALQTAQLQEFVASLPEGLDTCVGEGGIRLSGGQRQRIGIARALYRNPPLLVFDEATAALDSLTEEAMSAAMQELRGKHTLIIVAHRLSTVKNADCLFYFEQGRLLAQGDFNELCDKSPRFKEMVARVT